MAYADELLEVAQDLLNLHTAEPEPHQASLRRAVSTAYYALFHRLISEATANWARPELRATLGRCFDHGPMRTASEARIAQIDTALRNDLSVAAEEAVALQLRAVAKAFIQAQQGRLEADYNMAKTWTHDEVDRQIQVVKKAFQACSEIRDEAMAQAYLVSLLGMKERRPNEPKQPKVRAERKKKSPGRETP